MWMNLISFFSRTRRSLRPTGRSASVIRITPCVPHWSQTLFSCNTAQVWAQLQGIWWSGCFPPSYKTTVSWAARRSLAVLHATKSNQINSSSVFCCLVYGVWGRVPFIRAANIVSAPDLSLFNHMLQMRHLIWQKKKPQKNLTMEHQSDLENTQSSWLNWWRLKTAVHNMHPDTPVWPEQFHIWSLWSALCNLCSPGG